MRSPKTARRGGRRVRWPSVSGSARTRSPASGVTTSSSRGGSSFSRSRTIPTSRTSSSTWLASTWTHPSGRWCSASTRRRSARPSTAPSRACRCGRDERERSPTTTSGTAPPISSPHSTSVPVRCSYDCKKRHTARDVLSFFKLIDLHVPRELDIHVVLDNLSAHKAPEIKTWVAHPRRARWHLHFTPTSSSWLKLLTERRLRRGVFSSVEALREAIELWAEHWNDDPKPFVWRKTAEEIIEKVRRGRAALHQVHASRTTSARTRRTFRMSQVALRPVE